MTTSIINNILSDEEIEHINEIILNCNSTIDSDLGRIRTIPDLRELINPSILFKFKDIVNGLGHSNFVISNIMSVEYNPSYGKPNLSPHFDGDDNELIVNMQLSSNTVWDLGLNTQIYRLEDNFALVFNQNQEIHWRTHKRFEDGEYVKMLFVRFFDPYDKKDYSHLRLSQDHSIFKDANDFRDKNPQLTSY
jgi:hypothetical protein